MKLTMLAITLLVLMGTAMCQEPRNQAVSQPVARQIYAVLPSSPAVYSASQPTAPLPYFTFEPMPNLPHTRTQPSVQERGIAQPVANPRQRLIQPSAVEEARVCGCGR